MEIKNTETRPHPQLLEMLFAHKSKASGIFRDVLGLHEVHHVAITFVNSLNEILVFSSTPALEFNLFHSSLWGFDKTYHPHWFEQCGQSPWESLYPTHRFDELYYLKQAKFRYAQTLSLAGKLSNLHVIYSIASRKHDAHTHDLFLNQHEHFYKIGQYCTTAFLDMLPESMHPFSLQPEVSHAASK